MNTISKYKLSKRKATKSAGEQSSKRGHIKKKVETKEVNKIDVSSEGVHIRM